MTTESSRRARDPGWTDLEAEASDVGLTAGYNHANYLDAYGAEHDTPSSREVPARYAQVATVFTAAFDEGVTAYQERDEDQAGDGDAR